MRYTSDLKDSQWDLIKNILPINKPNGRNFVYDRRELINAIFYVLKNGVTWRDIPKDFPHWNSVYKYFIMLSERGIWMEINEILIEKVRINEGRNKNPSLAFIDSQSVKGDSVNKESGYDGNKKIKGAKRHIVVDVIGLILMCIVTSANTHDINVGRAFVSTINEFGIYNSLQKILVDRAYESLAEISPIEIEISTKDASIKGFVPLPQRWKVERTFAWLGKNRRLNRNYERFFTTHENFIFIANIRLMLNKLA